MNRTTNLSGFQSLEQIAELIGQIGRPAFESVLLRQLRGALGADHIGMFAVDRTGQLADWRVADSHDQQATLSTTRTFVQKIWPRDPRLLGVDPARVKCVAVSHRPASTIEDAEYRELCYRRPGVVDRLLLSGKGSHGVILLSIYRKTSSAMFSVSNCATAEGLANVLLAACDRHLTLSTGHTAPAGNSPSFDESALSKREKQVADSIAGGASSREIADDLQISLHTVLTYRKRIYEKLGVKTQRNFLARRFKLDSLPNANLRRQAS